MSSKEVYSEQILLYRLKFFLANIYLSHTKLWDLFNTQIGFNFRSRLSFWRKV